MDHNMTFSAGTPSTATPDSFSRTDSEEIDVRSILCYLSAMRTFASWAATTVTPQTHPFAYRKLYFTRGVFEKISDICLKAMDDVVLSPFLTSDCLAPISPLESPPLPDVCLQMNESTFMDGINFEDFAHNMDGLVQNNAPLQSSAIAHKETGEHEQLHHTEATCPSEPQFKSAWSRFERLPTTVLDQALISPFTKTDASEQSACLASPNSQTESTETQCVHEPSHTRMFISLSQLEDSPVNSPTIFNWNDQPITSQAEESCRESAENPESNEEVIASSSEPTNPGDQGIVLEVNEHVIPFFTKAGRSGSPQVESMDDDELLASCQATKEQPSNAIETGSRESVCVEYVESISGGTSKGSTTTTTTTPPTTTTPRYVSPPSELGQATYVGLSNLARAPCEDDGDFSNSTRVGSTRSSPIDLTALDESPRCRGDSLLSRKRKQPGFPSSRPTAKRSKVKVRLLATKIQDRISGEKTVYSWNKDRRLWVQEDDRSKSYPLETDTALTESLLVKVQEENSPHCGTWLQYDEEGQVWSGCSPNGKLLTVGCRTLLRLVRDKETQPAPGGGFYD